MGQGGSSGTAFKVSLSLPFLAQDPQLAALLPEGAAVRTVCLLQAAGLLDTESVSSVGRAWRWRVAGFVDRHLVPGQLLYLGLRKRFVDDEVRAALAAGATQVLVVGAGDDTLALRLAAAHPEVLFVEVDRPATLGRKRDGALALGLTPSNLRWLAVDLDSTLLDDALGDVEDWDGARRSIVVAEGLLMYLAPPACSASSLLVPVSVLRSMMRDDSMFGAVKLVYRTPLPSGSADGKEWAISPSISSVRTSGSPPFSGTRINPEP